MNLITSNSNPSTSENLFENAIENWQIAQQSKNCMDGRSNEKQIDVYTREENKNNEPECKDLRNSFHNEMPSSGTSMEKESSSDGDSSSTSVDLSSKSTPALYHRARTCFTMKQLVVLEKEYAEDSYLSRTRRKVLSKILQLPEQTVKVWFQNRRMKSKRQKKECCPRFHNSFLGPMNIPLPQEYLLPVQLPDPSLLPVVYHPTPYSYPVYMPYQTDNCNGQFYVTSHDSQYHPQYVSPEMPNVSPIQALEAQVLNCYKSCSQGYTNSSEVMPNLSQNQTNNQLQPFSPQFVQESSSPERLFRSFDIVPHVTHTPNENLFQTPFPSQFGQMDASQEFVMESGLLSNSPKENTKLQHNPTSEVKNCKNKFFRPFEDN